MGQASISSEKKWLEEVVMNRFDYCLKLAQAGITAKQVNDLYTELFKAPEPKTEAAGE